MCPWRSWPDTSKRLNECRARTWAAAAGPMRPAGCSPASGALLTVPHHVFHPLIRCNVVCFVTSSALMLGDGCEMRRQVVPPLALFRSFCRFVGGLWHWIKQRL